MAAKAPHKPVPGARERVDALRAELHGLYKLSEKTARTIERMEEISREIAEIQEGK